MLAIFNEHKGDTTEVNTLTYLGTQQTLPDSGIKYAQRGLALAEKINYNVGEADCYIIFSEVSAGTGNFAEAINIC